MKITKEMRASVPFRYATDVLEGRILTGQKIKQACQRFFRWIDQADERGFYLDHQTGLQVINFFPTLLNHTKGKMAGQPFTLAPFQQFTLYNVFAWKTAAGIRRINTVYDKRAKKNGKSAEMAGLCLYGLSFDMEMEAEIYVGATKEDQAKICWKQAKQFIESPVANPLIRQLGFRCRQREIINDNTGSVMMPLGGDSKTQDGINAHISIIDEYHAHKDDGVKENLESSSVQRRQPLTYHITTAGFEIAGVCKQYEDMCLDVLSGVKEDDHLWIMIHDLDDKDDWQDPGVWAKANPLLGHGLELEALMKEYQKAVNQPSKAPNFKTKHLNMWVDAPQIWIPSEIWDRNQVEAIPMKAFQEFGSYGGLDLSTTTDITAFVMLSEPDGEGMRYLKPYFFCPLDTIDRRSREDRVPYRYWADKGYLIATPGNTVDYDAIEDLIQQTYQTHKVMRVEMDQWNASQVGNNLQKKGIQCSFFSQAITNISHPTKQFEKGVYQGTIRHDGNPILKWMLSGCVLYEDPNENIKVHKGRSHMGNKRVDGIIAAIMALGGSLSIEKTDQSKYNNPEEEIVM